MYSHNILAISGSTRKNSVNHRFIKAIEMLTKEKFVFTVYEGLEMLPQFNPDNNFENIPQQVLHLRKLTDDADGVIICTPEYAHGVPGALKNAIDWTISTNQFSGKPTMLITASSDGRYGHAALLETLKVIEAKNVEQLQLLIQFAATKINNDCVITDAQTLVAVQKLIKDFEQTLHEKN